MMAQFSTLPNEQIIEFLHIRIGRPSALMDTNLFNMLSWLCPSYTGGLWELRVFPNGSFAYVYPDVREDIQARALSGMPCPCSLEVASLGANIALLKQMQRDAERFHDLQVADRIELYHDGLLNALRGNCEFVIEVGMLRESTADERERGGAPHPELNTILKIADCDLS